MTRLAERLLTRPALWAFVVGLATGLALASPGAPQRSRDGEPPQEVSVEELEESLR